MFTYEVIKKVKFDAAHFIPEYKGKCRNIHGHTWFVEAGVKGNKLENGMLFDFTILKKELKSICDEFDHKFLNELEEFKELAPTAENIGRVIYEKIEDKLDKGLELSFIKVFENPDSWVTVTKD
ncbi:putative queuosine biosynthesis protein QueD [Clostridium pasteurianum DSM 525 = ATCC 6013]|jgi:6-pyruvoyltetrahydropterin/6-carboxytetrahydropterin synthase|uniref:6-carboxy-5,6,7,8-tetrahydropterin synthase n=1 Tax=Clostridium pasteurianum DSM 525 = ATCC 6013 TaxID=1262449 RepID=A0A0H3J005_CLOPA|nr:6-carboxytetrahydropterin synthase QueD [Clostridium pasteurianum]AJA46639.1 putative queuosine biosynthesis protein QueD [Clostridium pasteurianum DSM 525 = ATCC 6013]AJA50627.1 putative queuosine biosynthesis protein QueD [Clostridium pasteurianum DSM 525 = ATCC 6013]AOZ74050.1 queuosine biosynthesis protein QueD [Clostridium pasteurianum DSM 525 = ATCC 6013]AOZ77847.1 queuosine biosynthesis protein QueD [Clostridium pasteurianum]ELP61204.1 putative queuosine biosynthesis protein QueD [Cl